MRTALFAILIVVSPVAAEATLTEITVPGPSLEGNLLGVPSQREVSVYLPPSYDHETNRRYPTMYILHGIMDSNFHWTRSWNDDHPGFDTTQALMDAGIEAGHVREMIVIIPDSDETSHYTDSPVRGGWERFIAEDLVSFIDTKYRTQRRAAARGIAGHSMGGHGAIKLAMKHPDVFGVAYGLNPSLLGWGADVAADNPAFAALADVDELSDLQNANFYVQAIVSIGHSFSPNPQAPLLTDLPFGFDEGELIRAQPGYDRWQSQMPIYMAADYVVQLQQLRGLRFDSAFEDEYTHIPATSLEFSRVLTELGIDHTFEMYNGDHRNRLWGSEGRLYTELLPYFSRLLE